MGLEPHIKNNMDELTTLKKENEELKKHNAVKSDLISISAHQLRTSLSALKWILKMLLDKDLGALSLEQESFIKKASDSNERMITLVNDMLTLNHSEDSALTFNFKPTDILSLIEETLFEFSGESHKKQIETIFLKPDHQLSQVVCDREMIRVVLQNLVENAIKYSNTGDKVFITLKEESGAIILSVRDTGIGISKEEQPKIFDKFFRAKNATAKEIIGSGLGLFTTQNIVNHHGGKIWFESNEDAGSTFFVSLPLTK